MDKLTRERRRPQHLRVLPVNMTAIEIREPGPPTVLRPARRPVPQPRPGEVLIKVAAAGVNRPDVLQRKGAYPPPPGASDIPGLEVAGVVVAAGEGVKDPAVGARVCALLAGGGYAEYATAPAVQCLPAPSQLTLDEAAALPETFFTVWYNVFERARLRAGETLLVHGGASGIGTTAILLGKAFGARVIVTAGNAAKCAACRELGADHAINYHEGDFVEATLRATDGRGADAVILAVGGNALIKTSMDAVRPGGKVMLFAQTQHGDATFDPGAVCMDEKTLMGSYSSSFGILNEVTDLVFAGYRNGFDLTQLISHRFSLEQAVAAIDVASHPKADSMKIMIEPVPGGGRVGGA